MLHLLRARCTRTASNASFRLETHQADALSFATSTTKAYDLIVTHFFLDCLTQPEVDRLATNISHRMVPDAMWLVSDFRIPESSARIPAKFLVRALYFAFRILTGLRTTQLPNHASALTSAGLICTAKSHSLFGILTTELWILPVPNSDSTIYNC